MNSCRVESKAWYLRYLQVGFFGRDQISLLCSFPLDQEEQFTCTDTLKYHMQDNRKCNMDPMICEKITQMFSKIMEKKAKQ